MSSAQVAARVIKELDPEDVKVLKALEKTTNRFESMPLSVLEKITRLDQGKLKFRLSRLNAYGFVIKSQFGYVLVSAGLDALALHYFVQKGLISGMGRSIGMGKESDVFEVISDSGENAVIKFYRIGRISFRATRSKRAYSTPEVHHQWLEINIEAARKEQEGLERALDAGVNSPKFISRNRHAVLMAEVRGAMLHQCGKEEIAAPESLFQEILANARKAYVNAKMINGDLSEYNILYDGELPWIIDWPQYVNTDHPNAEEILKRDLVNVGDFFQRKFRLEYSLEHNIQYVKGKKSTVSIS